ncbi:PLC-like phosphodiesterase [Dactylonectria macrodidyma]|uniref:Altered inheritance of mitochondria protein 6 n=1 Tax=Dactylonectria macrodidyma TaxID=307937 RepID=A0A9P9FPR0_9HYPO|nr:PLC-like phosphodiesterase [Dactylonectria macrodidyma]
MAPTRTNKQPNPKPCAIAAGLVGTAFATIGLLLALILRLAPVFCNDDGQSSPGNRDINLHSGGPSDTVPILCSSHNDYWRKRPLYSALLAGCVGIEADVWALRDELYVSHDRGRLTPDRTLSALYIDPLLKILDDRNSATGAGLPTRGVYATDPTQTLVLLVDIKANPELAWPLLLKKLKPLRKAGWLSYLQNGTLIHAPITVVGTGDTRMEQIEANSFRDIFLDAPLAKLGGGTYNSFNSYYASVSFPRSIGLVGPQGLRQSQLLKVRHQIKEAHSRGLKVRYWSLPAWPLSKRNHLWDVLVNEGLDILHVDDLLGVRDLFQGRQ